MNSVKLFSNVFIFLATIILHPVGGKKKYSSPWGDSVLQIGLTIPSSHVQKTKNKTKQKQKEKKHQQTKQKQNKKHSTVTSACIF